MPRILTATIAAIFVLSLLIYRFVPVPGAAADSTNYTLTLQFEGVGAVNVNPPNANRSVETVYTYPEGTDMVLTVLNPQPAPGWRFHHWENALTGSSLTGTVHLDANKVVKAVFIKCKLLVYKQGNGQVQVEIPSLSPETLTPPLVKSFYAPTSVTLTAIPATGYRFKNWIGPFTPSTTPTTNPITVPVDGETTVTAVFEQHKLTVNKTGSGQVTVTPPGETLTPPFTKYYDTATAVTLYADSAPGYAFKEWSNALVGPANPATLSVDGTKTAHAIFVVDVTKPIIYRAGSASVTVECGATWTDPGATASDNINGNITSLIVATNPVDLHAPGTYTITYNVSDEAANAAIPVTRSVTVEDTQAPVITLLGDNPMYLARNGTYTDPGATATDTCDTALPPVTVDSTDINSSAFGSYIVTYNVSDAESNAALEVTRTVIVAPTLTMAKTNAGNTTPALGTHFYPLNAVVSLSATPGAKFSHWEGDDINLETDNPIDITMTADKSVTAVFNTEIFFPDANLERAVRDAIGKPTGTILPSDLESLTTLDAGDYGIANLSGIQQLAALTSLVLSDNNISDLGPLAFLTGLSHLELSNVNPASLAPLASLTVLAELDLSNNGLEDVSALEGLNALAELDLSDNDISDLQSLIDTRILEGGTLDLTDNPLSSLAWHVQIEVLEGHIEEVTYNDALGHETDSLRTLVVGVKQGLGTITFNTVPTGGVEEHELTNYEDETYDLWLAEYPPDTGSVDAPTNPVSITAEPTDGDGYLDYWMGSYFAYGPRDTAELSVILFDDTKLIAFVETLPDMGTLDLVANFEDFVSEVLPAEDWETLDENGIVYDNEMTPLFVGNGMPDVVELGLLDAVLKDPEIDYSMRGGVVNQFSWKAWEFNLAEAEEQLDSAIPTLASKPYLARIVAAYMTFGDDDSVRWLNRALEAYAGPGVIESDLYDRSEQRYFELEGDADNDGAWNIDEWQGLTLTGVLLDNIAAYTEAALDPVIQLSPAEAGVGSARQAAGACAAAGCVGYVSIGVYNPNTPPFINQDLWLPSANTLIVTRSDTGETIPPGGRVSVPVGTEISVEAKEDAGQRYKFGSWGANGTLIDGSLLKKEKFYATWPTTIMAGFSRNLVVVPASTPTVTYSVGGALNAGAHPRYPGLVRYFLRPDQIATLSGKSTSYSRAAWVIQPGVGAAAPAHNRTDPTMVLSAPYAYINSVDPQEKQASVALLGSRGGYILGSANPYNRGAAWGSVVSGKDGLVRVDATPYAGYNWVGYASKGPYYSGPTTDWGVEYLVAGKNPYARAVFDKKNEHSMTLKVTGDDAPCSGYVMVEPAMKYYPHGTSVSLEATPVPGYVFMGWDVGGAGSVTRMGNEATVTMNSDRAVTAVFSWNDIEIKSADLCLDEIEIDLVGAAGVLVEYLGPEVDTHVIFSGGLPAGSSTISFNPATIPVGEFTTLRATVAGATAECETDSDTFDYHIENLGEYRHTYYNKPFESHASCDNGTTSNVCIATSIDPTCEFVTGVLSEPFRFELEENGSGYSENYGHLLRTWTCRSSAPSGCGSEHIFTQWPSTTKCGTSPVPGETVARDDENDDLACGDTVYVPGIGCRKVDDTGNGLGEAHLDHFSEQTGCNVTINNPANSNVIRILN